MDAASPIWPDAATDNRRHLEFVGYCWEAQGLLNDAMKRKSPFSILTLPEEITPFSDDHFEAYKKSKYFKNIKPGD